MVEFSVHTRRKREVGQTKEYLKILIHVSLVQIQVFEATPYGMSNDDAIKAAEEFLKNLRRGLADSGVGSTVVRKNV